MDPLGWRVSAAVVGSLMVLVMCRLALRLTGSVALASFAGLLLTFDGLHLTLSRMALLDIFVAFFLLLGVHLPGRGPRLVPGRVWRAARRLRRPTGPGSGRSAGCCSGRGCWQPG